MLSSVIGDILSGLSHEHLLFQGGLYVTLDNLLIMHNRNRFAQDDSCLGFMVIGEPQWITGANTRKNKTPLYGKNLH